MSDSIAQTVPPARTPVMTPGMIAAMSEMRRAERLMLDLWDTVRPGDGPVTAAMPWRTMAVDADRELQREAPDFALPGRQMVTWMGYSPGDGIVHGMSLWDPAAEARAPLPREWKACDLDLFRSLTREGMKGDRRAPYSFRKMPLPAHLRDAGFSSATLTHVMGVAQNIPLLHFVEALGVPGRVFGLIESSYGDPDAALSYVALDKSTSTMATLMWCAGNTQTRHMRRTDGALGPVPAGIARERRLQAVLAMPGFTSVLVTPDITYGAIDRAEELVPALADRLGIQPSTVRILGRAGAAADGATLACMRRAMDSGAVLAMLDAMPRSTLREMAAGLPAGGWTGLGELAFEFNYALPDEIVRHIGRGMRPAPEGSWDWLVTEGNRWQHTRDVTEQMSRDLLWPAEALADPAAEALAGRHDLADKLANLALGSLGAARVGRILDEHLEGTLRRAREVQAMGEAGIAEWRVPAEPVTARTGQVMRFLCSGWDLAHEGTRMDNCVGDYGDACASGRCAVMSIGVWDGEGTWRPSSTVELRRGGEDDAVRVIQHHGQGNSQPPPEDADLLSGWLAGIETGETLFDQFVLPPTADLSHISLALGDNWNTPEAAAARWDRWRRILDVRHHGAGEFLQSALRAMSIDPANGHLNGMEELVLKAVDYDRGMATLLLPDTAPALPAP